MRDAGRIAAAIDLRVRQLEAQGIKGGAMADHMLGHMHDLQRIYDTVSDQALAELCQRYPGFRRYAGLMEALSEKSREMTAAGIHPHADLPELSEPLKLSLQKLLSSAADLEREFQSAVDSGCFSDHASRLTAMKRQWRADLQKLVEEFRSSDISLRAQAMVQQAIKAMAVRIEQLGRG